MDPRLSARSFALITTSMEVFISLMEEAADKWGGRRFLKSAQESLEHEHEHEHEHDAATSARRELIDLFVRSRGRL